jgi:hypothetical protein
MTPDQRTKISQGIAFGVFFQYLGYFIRDVSTKHTPSYYGGLIGMVMGFLIFAWGCSHLVDAKQLPKWANVFGLFSLVGLAVLWCWPMKGQQTGVSGWLALFCLSLVAINPLATLIGLNQILRMNEEFGPVMLHAGHPPGWQAYALLCSVSLASMSLGIAAGIFLLKRTRHAVAMAKVFAATAPIGAFAVGGLPGLAGSLVYSSLWLTYLNKSRRVARTYEHQVS